MDVASQLLPGTDAVPPRVPVRKKRRRYQRTRAPVLVPKQRPITRANLDKRTLASRQFDAIVTAIRGDCGTDNLSVVQLALVEAFAGISVQLDALNTDVLLGKPVDQGAYCKLMLPAA